MALALVVDDEPLFREAVTQMLSTAGHDALSAASGSEGIDLGVRLRPDWLVVDWMLKDELHGLHVAAALQSVRPDIVSVLITGFPIEDLERAARDLGFSGIVPKPFDADALLNALQAPPSPRRRAPEAYGAVEVDAEGVVRWASPPARRILGIERARGRSLAHMLGATLPEQAEDRWVSVLGRDVRLREPWPDGARLVLLKETGKLVNETLVALVLGRHQRAGRWNRGRVLVVDDLAITRVMSCGLLEASGATCYTAGTHEAALRYIAEDPGLDVAIVDYEMPDGDVADLIARARRLRPDLVLIGNSGGDNRERFRALGVDRYVDKPWRLSELLHALEPGA